MILIEKDIKEIRKMPGTEAAGDKWLVECQVIMKFTSIVHTFQKQVFNTC